MKKMTAALVAKGMTKDYGDFSLEGIDLELRQGELFGCLGPNGSGKTTLVKLLTGQLSPTEGEAKVLGRSVTKDPVKAKEVIGIIPEQESPPSFLTVKEYLEFICKVRKLGQPQRRIARWLSFFDYEEEQDRLIRDLSRGTKQKVVATQAFIHEPRLVFIDEPLINLDPVMQKRFKDFLVEYVKKGNTVFLSTHVLSIAEEICTDIGILKEGRMIHSGSMKDVRKKGRKLEDYVIGMIQDED